MNKNKFLTALMTGAMIMGSTLPVYAATSVASIENYEPIAKEDDDTSTTTKETEVLYSKSSTFTVTIPKTIVLGNTKTSDYTVNVKGDISSDKQVKVAPDASFYMKDQATVGKKKTDVEATVTQAVTVWSSEEVCHDADGKAGTDKQGNVAALGLTSGSWAGTFQFSIALEAVK